MNRVIGSTQYLKRIKSIIESKNSWGKNELISMLQHEHLEYIESLDKVDENMNNTLKNNVDIMNNSILPTLNEVNISDEMGESNFTYENSYNDEDDLPF